MYKKRILSISMMLLISSAHAEEPDKNVQNPGEGDKLISGMSIVGNDEAPKSLVIVPWKSSELGDTLAVSRGLGSGRNPVDREVFLRELNYYEIRTGFIESPDSSEE